MSESEQKFEEAQQDYLAALIQAEIVNMLLEAGCKPEDNLMQSLAALGGADVVGEEARRRVLDRDRRYWHLRIVK
jgi:hypothetical protein